MHDETTERALIGRIQHGDEQAVSTLAERYWPRIHGLATRLLKNPEDGEEVAQDVLLKVSRQMGAFRSESALFSWIYRITFNAAMSHLRAERSHRRVFAASIDEHITAIAFPATRPDAILMRSQLRKRVVKGLLKLSPEYRNPVLLRDVRGLSTREAALALQVNSQTLKTRLRRSRRVLRRYLAELAGGLS